jgi:hypothetical protein
VDALVDQTMSFEELKRLLGVDQFLRTLDP